MDANIFEGFTAGVGVYAGGAFYDSMRRYSIENGVVSKNKHAAGPLNSGQEYIADNYIVNNAFLSYKDDLFYVKAGRYKSGAVGYFFSSYNQGAEFALSVADAKIWGFWSDKRAHAYSSWLYDYYAVNGTVKSMLAGGAEYTHHGLKGGAFLYYKKDYFTAPGLVVEFDSSDYFGDDGLVSKTKFVALFPQSDSSKVGTTVRGAGSTRWGTAQKSSATYYLEQKFVLDKYNFGAALYLNRGNPNEYIGNHGNPIMLDYWTTSMYDIGAAISDVLGKNAVSPILFAGANYGKFEWNLLARYTNADRSNESSLGLLVDYKLREDVTIGGKLEYLSDTTKAGYAVGVNGVVPGASKRTDDRSHAFFYIEHTF